MLDDITKTLNILFALNVCFTESFIKTYTPSHGLFANSLYHRDVVFNIQTSPNHHAALAYSSQHATAVASYLRLNLLMKRQSTMLGSTMRGRSPRPKLQTWWMYSPWHLGPVSSAWRKSEKGKGSNLGLCVEAFEVGGSVTSLISLRSFQSAYRGQMGSIVAS